MKKVLTMIISVMLLLAVAIPAMASSDNVKLANSTEVQSKDAVSVKEIYKGVSPIQPTDINIEGTSIPSNVWNIPNSGYYPFSGVSSNGQDLYTNYKLTGKNSYTVRVVNDSDHNLTVKVKTLLTTYSTNTVAPGTTSEYSVAGMSSTTQFYILFQGDYKNFYGWIM